jgi:hypothetical protein
MEKVAHDAIGDSPVIAVHTVVMRAQGGFPRELQTTRSAKTHAPRMKRRPCQALAEIPLGIARDDAVQCQGHSPGNVRMERSLRMRLCLWVAFFVVANLLGVEVFKAAVTLPWDEALLPGLLTLPLVGLSALGATRIVAAWQRPEE